MSPNLCRAISTLRRTIQRIDKRCILFLDEAALRLNEAPRSTIVMPGETAYVVVDDNTAYARRYDMIACCTIDRVFPPIIYTPDERKQEGVKGINKHMLLQYIRNILAQACGALDRYPLYLVLDRARIHHVEDIIQEFHDWGCQELKEVWKMPTKAAKRMSPLDNSIFHDWKERIRSRGPILESNIEQLMTDEWNNITPRILHAHYKHCGLFRDRNTFFDCPDPATHKHKTSR